MAFAGSRLFLGASCKIPRSQKKPLNDLVWVLVLESSKEVNFEYKISSQLVCLFKLKDSLRYKPLLFVTVKVAKPMDGTHGLESSSCRLRMCLIPNNLGLVPIQTIVGAVYLLSNGRLNNNWIFNNRINLETWNMLRYSHSPDKLI